MATSWVDHPGIGWGNAYSAEMVSPARSTAMLNRLLLGFALVSTLAALAFPFAPVRQPEVRYYWSASDTAAAIPLLPYQPLELRMTTTCSSLRVAVRAAGPRVALSTTPLRPDPAAAPLYGLRLTTTLDELRLVSAGVELGSAALPPARDCTVALISDPRHTQLLIDDAAVLSRDGDVRPDVVGAFSELPGGLGLTLTADTRFQTTMSPVKAALGALCLTTLIAVLVLLGRADRTATPRVRLLPRGWWRPRAVDAAVGVLLGGWWLVGAVTVDDGYIAGIVRSRDANGFVGNAFRWLNAPEAPFSWIYESYDLWSGVSTSTGWLRLPSTLLGLLCWALLRLLLPRLGPFARRPAARWLAALAFGTWWIPFNLGLRPEPWIAVGGLAVFLCLERTLATRRVRPLTVGLLLAAASTAVTPGGVMAFAPLAAAAPRLVRLARARRDLHRWPLLAVLVAAPAAAVLLMVSDQSASAVVEAVRVRQLIGGGGPWYAEYERYAALLEPDSFQGAIGRRAAVLVTLLAAAATLSGPAHARPAAAGLAYGPTRRLVLAFLIGVAAMTASPTKWSQHFGDLAGLGAAVLVVGLVVAGPVALRDRPRRRIAGFAAGTAVAALVLSGRNLWPSVSGWFTPSFSTVPVGLAGVPLATITCWPAAWSCWRCWPG